MKGIIPFGGKGSSDHVIGGSINDSDSALADLFSKTWMQVIVIAVLGGIATCVCALIYYFKQSQRHKRHKILENHVFIALAHR